MARKLAQEVLDIFYELFEGGYEIEKIRLVDEYDADDERSMADNNSSASIIGWWLVPTLSRLTATAGR